MFTCDGHNSRTSSRRGLTCSVISVPNLSLSFAPPTRSRVRRLLSRLERSSARWWRLGRQVLVDHMKPLTLSLWLCLTCSRRSISGRVDKSRCSFCRHNITRATTTHGTLLLSVQLITLTNDRDLKDSLRAGRCAGSRPPRHHAGLCILWVWCPNLPQNTRQFAD